MTQARDLMARFAERTGVTSSQPPRRYLWTDAFAVCNFLGLDDTKTALRLVERVHHTLGRHRDDDARTGWISGLDELAGEASPTSGGLRIGKPLPERRANEVPDERLDWDRDGQYFHYLTKWMHALDQVARATGRPMFHEWARQLGTTAHRRFVYRIPSGSAKRMYWKMSIDLSRPVVASMGQHDPLDGLITCAQLGLDREAADFASMLDERSLATDDPLGLGGLLVDAYRAERLAPAVPSLAGLAETLLAAAAPGLQRFRARRPDGLRLAFRELGLAIGLAAAQRMARSRLPGQAELRGEIEAHWLRPEHRRAPIYVEHEDINDVMLATSLAPDGFLRM
jgi:hypothetical protein